MASFFYFRGGDHQKSPMKETKKTRRYPLLSLLRRGVYRHPLINECV